MSATAYLPIRALVAGIVAFALISASCSSPGRGQDSSPQPTTSGSTETTTDKVAPLSSTTAEEAHDVEPAALPRCPRLDEQNSKLDDDQVLVFFPCSTDRSPAVASFLRQVPPGESPARYAFEQYFNGPTTAERELGAGAVLIGDDWELTYNDERLLLNVDSGMPQALMLAASDALVFSIRLTGGAFSEHVEIQIDSMPLSEYTDEDG